MLKRKFRPNPYRRSRGRVRFEGGLARFYGLYMTNDGRKKRFSFSVRAERYRAKVLHKLFVVTVNALKYQRKVPEHKAGHVFNSFHELLKGTQWFAVRKILSYKAEMVYER